MSQQRVVPGKNLIKRPACVVQLHLGVKLTGQPAAQKALAVAFGHGNDKLIDCVSAFGLDPDQPVTEGSYAGRAPASCR